MEDKVQILGAKTSLLIVLDLFKLLLFFDKPESLQIISNMKQSIITRLIEKHADWASTLEEIDVNQALWFYSLMSVVEKPLHPDIESSMRSFVLVCSKQRSRQNNRKTRELRLTTTAHDGKGVIGTNSHPPQPRRRN